MLKVSATAYLKLGKRIEEGRCILMMVRDANVQWDEREKHRLRETMQSIRKHASTLKLETTHEVFSEWIEHNKIPETMREWDYMTDVVTKELSRRLFLFVPPHVAIYYERDDCLNDKAKRKFPKANQELRNAGNCFAAGMSTACVFHCMRCLEYGIGALADAVDVVFDTQNWQNILDQIEKAIKKERETLPKGRDRNDRLQFLSEAVAEFRYFKDGWRNYANHNKINYDEAQGLKTMEHVSSFIEVLSTRLDEQT